MAEPSVSAQFVSVTGTDEELAKYYLMENGNDLERALNMYFANQSHQDNSVIVIDEDATQDGPSAEEVTCVDAEEDDKDALHGRTTKEPDVAHERPSSSSTSDPAPLDIHLKLICWNIQGLEEKMLHERTVAVINILKRESPDVVFLQEVIPPTLGMLHQRFSSDYHIFPGGRIAYFTALLLKKKRFHLETVVVEPFPASQMLRNLIVAKSSFHGISLQLMTSHIESMANYAAERKSQLKSAFTHMTNSGSNVVSIFGGDTNAKDKEIQDLAEERADIEDIWEALGSSAESRFTWDMLQNDNLDLNGRKPRIRYDRVFLHQRTKLLSPTDFTLIGKERLPCGMFASDHWGILTNFKVVKSPCFSSSSS